MRQWASQDGRVSRWRSVADAALVALAIGVASMGTVESIDGAAGIEPEAEPGAGAADTGRMACDPGRPTALPRTVAVHLSDRVGLSPEALDELRRAAAAPWVEAGVALVWLAEAPTTPSAAGESTPVYVSVSDASASLLPEAESARASLAHIRFVSGSPTTHVMADAGVARRLLATARLDDQPYDVRPRLQRERALGRVLGRAVAHEIGHYLFASSAHAEVGLMRAAHRIEHLTAVVHPAFRVVAPAIPTCLMTMAAAK
jgi:hypothetical protein